MKQILEIKLYTTAAVSLLRNISFKQKSTVISIQSKSPFINRYNNDDIVDNL
jgi:hypothetical protein